MPPSVYPCFMVKVHKDIHKNTCWRTGVLLEDKRSGVQAVVKADEEKRRINIWVHGPRRKEYLHFLWYSLRQINASFEKLKVSTRIPMPDDSARTADYDTLLNYAEQGISHYIPEGSDKKYSVHELLGQVQPDGAAALLHALRILKAQLADKESATEAFNSLFELKPNIAGIGLNLNEAFKRIAATQKGK